MTQSNQNLPNQNRAQPDADSNSNQPNPDQAQNQNRDKAGQQRGGGASDRGTPGRTPEFNKQGGNPCQPDDQERKYRVQSGEVDRNKHSNDDKKAQQPEPSRGEKQ